MVDTMVPVGRRIVTVVKVGNCGKVIECEAVIAIGKTVSLTASDEETAIELEDSETLDIYVQIMVSSALSISYK